MQHELFRWDTVHRITQLSRTTVWRLERDGKFPQRRKLSANTVGWLKVDIDTWVQSRSVVATTTTPGAAQ